ncbi:MAG: VWA domain-containing protein [Planctomycetota bacterium]
MVRFASQVALIAALVALAAPAQAEMSKADFNRAKKKLKFAQVQQDGDALAAVLEELAADDSKRAVELVLGVAATNQLARSKVDAAAAKSLDAMTSDGATGALIAALGNRRSPPLVKILVAEALGKRKDGPSAQALGDALSDGRPEVLRAVIRAVHARKAGETVPGLLSLLEKLEKHPDAWSEHEVQLALVECTGKWFEKLEDWKQFWAQNAHKGERVATGSAKAAMETAERAKQPPPKFFGTEIRSERVVFVIDVSGSMEGERLAKCKAQLTQCISGLTARSSFTVLVYSNQIRPWNARLQPATPQNKASAVSFVETLRATGNTCTRKAMLQALEVADADTVVLLSDGMPTGTKPDGKAYSEAEVLDDVSAENTRRQREIHTFGFGTKGSQLADFMENLAKKNHGRFTAID